MTESSQLEPGSKDFDVRPDRVRDLLNDPDFKVYKGIIEVRTAIEQAVKDGKASPELEKMAAERLGTGPSFLFHRVLKEKGWKSEEIGTAVLVVRGEGKLPE